MPLFVTTDNSRKVDMTDADFVDVLHTNALEKGKLEASGHVDFYANGGLTQPGCKASEEQSKQLDSNIHKTILYNIDYFHMLHIYINYILADVVFHIK